jgi:hypothetical protein
VLRRKAVADAELAAFDLAPDQALQLPVQRGRRIPVEDRRGLLEVDRSGDGNACFPNLSI